MHRVPLAFHNRLQRGEVPIPYIIITTHMGDRAYAEKELTAVFDLAAVLRMLDGSFTLDGSARLGDESTGVIEKSGRVLSFGSFERTLQNINTDVLGSYQSKQLQHMSVQLDDADGRLAQLIAKEPFIGRPMKYFLGFEALPQADHLCRFSGTIMEMDVMGIMTIEADEE